MDCYELYSSEQLSGSWLSVNDHDDAFNLTKTKNKYQSRQIAREFNNRHRSKNCHSLRSSQRRKLPRNHEHISYDFQKATRSQQRSVTSLSFEICKETVQNIEYIQATKSEHLRRIKQRLQFLEQRKSYKTYQHKSSGRRQTKQRQKTEKTATTATKKEERKPVPTRFDKKMYRNRQSLRIKCNILFTHDATPKEQDAFFKVMKCEISIFDVYKRSYWSGFSFIPAIKEKPTKGTTTFSDKRRFTVRDDLTIKIDHESGKTADDNYIFYYIAQYCYECRTPYIEYSCRINEALKTPIWKLADVHFDNEHHHKFILNYSIRDILQSHRTLRDDVVLSDDVILTLCSFLGYSSVGMTVIDGLCEYDIDDRKHRIRDELAFWKKYKPPYANGDVIQQANGEHLSCHQVYKRLRCRKSNGIENWHYNLWQNVPCSMHSALYQGVRYIDDETGAQKHTSNWGKYHNVIRQGTGTEFGPNWWEY